MMKKNFSLICLVAFLILISVLSRFMAHAWNFTLIGGVAIFAGAVLRQKSVAVFVVFASLLLSDAIIGFHSQMLPVYFGFLVMMALGSLLTLNSARLTVLATSVLGSFCFFLITNFSVWFEGALYPRTLNGLMNCYVMAIPFFKNQLFSDVLSTSALFAGARIVQGFVTTKFQGEFNK